MTGWKIINGPYHEHDRKRTIPEILESLRDNIFSIAYQIEMEREYGERSGVEIGALENAMTTMLTSYQLLDPESDDWQEIGKLAYKTAIRAVWGD